MSRSVAKSSLACTGISATAKEREKVWYKFLTHILDTRDKFGCTEERNWSCMIGMNKKGGMTDEELKKYINNSIVPLYLNLEDTPGKRALLKVDSGPGCNGRELLMSPQFYGLPNATSMQ